MIIRVSEKIMMATSTSAEKLGDDVYKVYCVKYPFHKDDLGYKGCCPPVGHEEYNIAYRENHCSLNFLNTDDFRGLNRKALELGIEHALGVLGRGSGVCFVDNTLESVAPLVWGVVCYRAGILGKKKEGEKFDINRLLVELHGIVPQFNPKVGQVALFNSLLNQDRAGCICSRNP